ncbi:MAG: glycosyltransferase family 2 protein [Planctomycetota bacterium]
MPDAQAGRGLAGMVSVVIACYNHASYLSEAVDSVLAQTYAHREIVVVDDGSTDNTPEVAGRYGDRIRYVRQENAGLSGAKNTGLREARGEFVNFLDADDVLLPRMLEKVVRRLAQSPAAGAAFCATILSNGELRDRSWVHSPSLSDCAFDDLAHANHLNCHSLVWRRDTLRATGWFDTSLKACEDWDFWLRAARRGVQFVRVPEALVVYRMVASSMSRRATPFYEAGKTVILTGHAPDPRVGDPAPEHAQGCRSDPSETIAQWAINAACIAVAGGRVGEACELLETANGGFARGLQPEHFASRLYSLLYGSALTPTQIDELWLRTGRPLMDTLIQTETRIAKPGFAMQSLLEITGHPRLQAELDAMRAAPTQRIAARLRRILTLFRTTPGTVLQRVSGSLRLGLESR